MPTRAQEAILVEKARLTRLAFVEIMCKVLSRFIGRPVVIAAEGSYAPATPLVRAEALLYRHRDELDPETHARLEKKLSIARKLAVDADRLCVAFEREIKEVIVAALAGRGETLADSEIN